MKRRCGGELRQGDQQRKEQPDCIPVLKAQQTGSEAWTGAGRGKGTSPLWVSEPGDRGGIRSPACYCKLETVVDLQEEMLVVSESASAEQERGLGWGLRLQTHLQRGESG